MNFKLAMVQMDCEFGNVDANLTHAEEMIRKAAKEGANIICLPECFNVGYSVHKVAEMAKLAEPLDGKTVSHLSALAKELRVYLIAPIISISGIGVFQNTAVFISEDGSIIGSYSKTHTIGGEKNHLKRGGEYPVFKTKYGNIGILICYDIAHPETSRILALKDAQLIVVPAAWRDLPGMRLGFNTNLVCRAIDNILFVAGVNRVGRIDDVDFCGDSQIVDPLGSVLAKGKSGEDVVIAEIDFNRVLEERYINPILSDRHPEDYAPLCIK